MAGPVLPDGCRFLRAVVAAVTFVLVVAATPRLAVAAQANSGRSQSFLFCYFYFAVKVLLESSICLQNARDLKHIRPSAAVSGLLLMMSEVLHPSFLAC